MTSLAVRPLPYGRTVPLALACLEPAGPRDILLLFFFNDTAPTEIYTLSLHDALPISEQGGTHGRLAELELLAEQRLGNRTARRQPAIHDGALDPCIGLVAQGQAHGVRYRGDRKSTRLNSSHVRISYAVFCLKKKKKTK